MRDSFVCGFLYFTQKCSINSVCDNKVWRVDIGASNAFHEFKHGESNVEVLEITYKNNKPIFNILKQNEVGKGKRSIRRK